MSRSHASLLAPPLSRPGIRAFARQIRRSLEVDDDLWFPAVELVEMVLPTVVPGLVFEVVEASRCPDHGLTFRREAKTYLWIREDVYDRACVGKGRDRGTCAHEGGHALLHMDTPMLARSFGQEVPRFRDPEWQAMAFQGELLVPHHLVRGMGVDDVARRCGVSTACAELQLRIYASTK